MKISDHNRMVGSYYAKPEPERAGVECDHCNGDMVYVGSEVLDSFPPKRQVKCSKCGAQSYKIC